MRLLFVVFACIACDADSGCWHSSWHRAVGLSFAVVAVVLSATVCYPHFAMLRSTNCVLHSFLSSVEVLRITGKFPGYLSPSAGLKFADVPNGLAAISKVPAAGWGQILAYMAFCEVSQDQSAGTAAAAGDFGFKVLTSSDPAEKTKKLSAELANGRLAMMAIIGMFFQAGLSHACDVNVVMTSLTSCELKEACKCQPFIQKAAFVL